MSKAVLMIDKPNCCGNCELIVSMYSEQYEEWYEICHITQKKIFDTEKIDKECPLQMTEPLTDAEQRIFLAAMAKEEKVCKQVDDECRQHEDSLVKICHEITRKVKGALWT